MLLSSDLINRLAPLELKARHIVEGFISGLHRSPYYGFSVEFAEHRPYNPGDELRHVDWKVWAKTERFFVKQYEEETNLRCHILLDVSSSMNYKYYAELTKKEYGIYLSAAFLYLMQKQRDAVGLSLFDEQIRESFPSKASEQHLRLLYKHLQDELEDQDSKKQSKKTATADIINDLAERLKQRSLVVIVSDLFENMAESDKLLAALKRLRHAKHEVIVFHLLERESEVDFKMKEGRVRLEDLETGRSIDVIPSQVVKDYRKKVRSFLDEFRALCSEVYIDLVEIDTMEKYDIALLAYLNKRKRVG